jgi:hypothetical protein
LLAAPFTGVCQLLHNILSIALNIVNGPPAPARERQAFRRIFGGLSSKTVGAAIALMDRWMGNYMDRWMGNYTSVC